MTKRAQNDKRVKFELMASGGLSETGLKLQLHQKAAVERFLIAIMLAHKSGKAPSELILHQYLGYRVPINLAQIRKTKVIPLGLN